MSFENLPGSNVYGEVFIPKMAMVQAMYQLGLSYGPANHRSNSSAVRFAGEIDGIQVRLECNAMVRNADWGKRIGEFRDGTAKYAYGYDYVGYVNLTDSPMTHFKMDSWIPKVTHLTGKGSRNKAWEIYQKIWDLITAYTAEAEDVPEPIDPEYTGLVASVV